MTFLSPISAIFAAAVTVPLLVMLYLLKLRRRPMRVSTTVFWEQARGDLQANVPLRWLRPSWLLLLHLLILALLVLALGRPAAVLPSGFGGASRVVFLIDRSASMSATDAPGGTTRLDAAKQRALEAIDELAEVSGGRSAIVVSFASDAAALTRWTASRGLLRDAVRSIEPTDQPGDLPGAMKLVEAVAAGTAEDEAAPEPPLVLVYSDGSFKIDSPIQAAGLRVRLEVVPEQPISAATSPDAVIPPTWSASQGAPASRDNLGITTIAARRDYADPTRVRLFLKVQSASVASGVLSTPLTLSLNGEVVERRVLDVPSVAAPESQRSSELGSASALFEFPAPQGGLVLAQLGRADFLASDNSASLVLAPPASPAILLYRPKPDGPTVEGEAPPLSPSDWILEDALGELRPRTLTIRAGDEAVTLDQADLNAHDLIIFDRVTPSVLPPLPALYFGVVPRGAGVDMPSWAERQMRSEAPGAPFRPSAGPVVLWERDHPILRDTSLDSLYVGRDKELRIEPTPPEGVKVTELARGRDRPLLVLSEIRGVRHVIVGFDLAESNWPTQVSFPIFLASTVNYLTLRGESSLGKSFTTSQPVTIAVRPRAGTVATEGSITIRGPIDATADIRSDGQASFGVLSRAGVYVVDSPRGLDRAVAVNLVDPIESAIAVERNLTIGSTASLAGEGQSRRELWPWFVLAATILLVIEWVVYAVRMRA